MTQQIRSPKSDYGAVAMGNIGNTAIRFRIKASIRFIDFVRPDGYWPAPYTLEQAFEVFRWMVRTGVAMKLAKGDTGTWGTSTVNNLLGTQPTCTGNIHGGVNIYSIDRLRKGFQYAVLSGHAGQLQSRWRHENNVLPTGERIIHFRHHAPFFGPQSEADIRTALETYFSMGQQEPQIRLVKQLNSSYADAVELQSTNVRIMPDGFRFWIQYGVDGSGWDHELTRTKGNETFIETFQRADRVLQYLTGEDSWPDARALTKEPNAVQIKRGRKYEVLKDGVLYRIEYTGRRESRSDWHIMSAEPIPEVHPNGLEFWQ